MGVCWVSVRGSIVVLPLTVVLASCICHSASGQLELTAENATGNSVSVRDYRSELSAAPINDYASHDGSAQAGGAAFSIWHT